MKKFISIFLLSALLTANSGFAIYLLSFKENPLSKAIDDGKTEEALNFIKNEPLLISKKERHVTPLMAAAYKGNWTVLKALLAAGASARDKDEDSYTALSYYLDGNSSQENVEISELLISLTRDLNEGAKKKNSTPIWFAAKKGFCKTIQLLAAAGAKIDLKGNEQQTPLTCAISKKRDDAALLLISLGANLNTRDVLSMTPLMYAAYNNRGRVISILLRAGADRNLVTTEPITVTFKENWYDQSGEQKTIPKGSTALDIATVLDQKYARYHLMKESR